MMRTSSIPLGCSHEVTVPIWLVWAAILLVQKTILLTLSPSTIQGRWEIPYNRNGSVRSLDEVLEIKKEIYPVNPDIFL